MWHQIHGHDAVVERFRQSIAAGRLASTYLFVGTPGIGKRMFALKLAEALLCHNNDASPLDPCGQCESCTLVGGGTHPDLLLIAKPEGKSVIPVETFIGDQEHRMRVGLCHDIAMKPFLGGRKVAIIDDADFMNNEGANSLLKTLEEPPADSILILIGSSAARQLPTIRSRCQILRFQPLESGVVADLLLSGGIASDPQEAQRLALLSGGSPGRAIEMADSELNSFRDRLLEQLTVAVLDSVRLSTQVSALVDEAGREATKRRDRLRQVIVLVAEYYRELMRQSCGAGPCEDPQLQQAVSRGLTTWTGDAERSAAMIDRCLQTLQYIDRNANQSTVIQCWLDDLERIAAGGPILTV